MAQERRGWLYVVGGFLGAVAAIALFPSQMENAYRWFAGKFESLDAVELPATYPGELWKVAKAEDFSWLEGDEWCYPTIPGFRTRFRVVAGALERQNYDQTPKPSSEWWKTKTYMSNHGVLRIRYETADLPGDYIDFTPGKTAEWKEYQRFGKDDGATTSGKKRLVLSCTRCTLSNDGITYECR